MDEQVTSENRKRVAVLAVMLIVAVVAFIVSVSNPSAGSPAWASSGGGPRNLSNGDPDLLNYSDAFIGSEELYYATGPANVRNYPTPRKTYKLWRLERCVTITARKVRGFTAGETWVKLSGDGSYVWDGNLAPARGSAFRRDCPDDGPAAE